MCRLSFVVFSSSSCAVLSFGYGVLNSALNRGDTIEINSATAEMMIDMIDIDIDNDFFSSDSQVSSVILFAYISSDMIPAGSLRQLY